MSPNPASSFPPRWSAFLKEVDGLLPSSVELHCLGGFVLAALYGLPRPTGDLDYIAAIPLDSLAGLEKIAGKDSALTKKHGLYFQHVTVADVPENYTNRLTELFSGRFSRLHLLALEVHDLVLAKLVRNSPVDLEDAKFLAKAGKLHENVVRKRYQQELRPLLSNEARHELTLKLWLEACFHPKPSSR